MVIIIDSSDIMSDCDFFQIQQKMQNQSWRHILPPWCLCRSSLTSFCYNGYVKSLLQVSYQCIFWFWSYDNFSMQAIWPESQKLITSLPEFWPISTLRWIIDPKYDIGVRKECFETKHSRKLENISGINIKDYYLDFVFCGCTKTEYFKRFKSLKASNNHGAII